MSIFHFEFGKLVLIFFFLFTSLSLKNSFACLKSVISSSERKDSTKLDASGAIFVLWAALRFVFNPSFRGVRKSDVVSVFALKSPSVCPFAWLFSFKSWKKAFHRIALRNLFSPIIKSLKTTSLLGPGTNFSEVTSVIDSTSLSISKTLGLTSGFGSCRGVTILTYDYVSGSAYLTMACI